jgi:hypothetical protein
MNNPLATLFDQFLKERTYLKNVTPSTLIWYRVAFKNYAATIADDAPPMPTKAAMQQFVITQRERGIRPDGEQCRTADAGADDRGGASIVGFTCI